MVLVSVLISVFTCSCLLFRAPRMEEAVFSPLYILPFFIKDKLTICAWVYLRVFYPVPLIYISVFLPVPYCLDYCSFAVESEVLQFHFSFSRLLWLFGVFFVSIQIVKFFCFSFVKNAIGSLIGIALNL